MSTHPVATMNANTALGRAVATCGDAEETGCDLCGYVVAARDPRSSALKNMRTSLVGVLVWVRVRNCRWFGVHDQFTLKNLTIK